MEQEQTDKRVLVVAADHELQHALSIPFSSAGYRVYGASNGYAALKQMEKQPVDLVLADYQMQMMDGLEFLSVSRLRWPGTPVVVLSGEQADQEKAQGQGAIAWIRKGCEPTTLLDAVTMILQRSVHH
jgi:two-component system, response regulator FlrC